MPYKLSMSASRLPNDGSASDRVDRAARRGSRKSNRNFMMMRSRGYRRRSMIRRRSGCGVFLRGVVFQASEGKLSRVAGCGERRSCSVLRALDIGLRIVFEWKARDEA
jgi:hypothetical protein